MKPLKVVPNDKISLVHFSKLVFLRGFLWEAVSVSRSRDGVQVWRD